VIFYSDELSKQSSHIRLIERDSVNHIIKVLRKTTGTSIRITDGNGLLAQGTISRINRKEPSLLINCDSVTLVPPPSYQVTTAVAFIKHPALELMLQKLVEVGVHRILLFPAAHSDFFTIPFSENGSQHPAPIKSFQNKQQRWNQIIREACKQSERVYFPSLHILDDLNKIFENPSSTRYILADNKDGHPPNDVLAMLKTAMDRGCCSNHPFEVTLIIGPEGGLTDAERDYMGNHHIIPFCFPHAIMRSETAAICLTSFFSFCLTDQDT
jgi:16S rRNA (uracil1498-N3)-methyltransferase